MSLSDQMVILQDIINERKKQDAKWGEQHHPDGTVSNKYSVSMANYYRGLCNAYAKSDIVTWKDILLEEIYEALAEDDLAKLRNELVQSAAVIVNWIEDIDSREQ